MLFYLVKQLTVSRHKWLSCASIKPLPVPICSLSISTLSPPSWRYTICGGMLRTNSLGELWAWHFRSAMDHLFGSTLMAAAAVKKRRADFADGRPGYYDSQPPNCSFEVITRQVRAIWCTKPETNRGGRAGLMRSQWWGNCSARGHLLQNYPAPPRHDGALTGGCQFHRAEES